MGADSKQSWVIERNQRLSRSLLWELQRRFFAESGIEAWRRGIVPHHITSNPFIARAYSAVVQGFLRDCERERCLDPREPVTILELGAGSGRFAHAFLRWSLPAFARLRDRGVRVRYLMTDLVPSTVEFWGRHPWLEKFHEAGYLEFARFDVERDRSMALIGSEERLSPGTVSNPLIAIANYVFDGIPQDVFRVRAGRLEEGRATLTVPATVRPHGDPDLLRHVELGFEYHGTTPTDYYSDPAANRVLDHYREHIADATFLFPCAAMEVLRRLGTLSCRRTLLLAGDRGGTTEQDLLRSGDPIMALHGSFSFPVRFDALGRYVEALGGRVLQPRRSRPELNVSAFTWGVPPREFPETQRAYQSTLDRFAPGDYFRLKKRYEDLVPKLAPDRILAFLRLSEWDSEFFLTAFPVLSKAAPDLSPESRKALGDALLEVWEGYLPLQEETDLAFHIGVVFYAAGDYAMALRFFHYSLALYGPCSETAHDIGLCYSMLERRDLASAWIQESLRLDRERASVGDVPESEAALTSD